MHRCGRRTTRITGCARWPQEKPTNPTARAPPHAIVRPCLTGPKYPSFRISELPKPLAEREEESFRPIQVQGKPLSETIIEERSVK